MSSSGPASSAVGNVSMPSASAARATASASMRSDLPRSRLDRRELAISRVGTRTTRSPRAIRNRSNEPETCRQSSSAQTRSTPRAARPLQHLSQTRAHRPRPSCRRASRPSPRRRRRSCASSCACPHRARSSAAVPFFSRLKWTAGGHGLLRALPRSFQVTPDIPDRRRATQQKEVRPDPGRQPQRESARRRSGPSPQRRTSPTTPNHNSKPQSSSELSSSDVAVLASCRATTWDRVRS